MMRALWSAASGMKTQQENMDVIANNIANVNTTGGKKQRAEFQDLIYQTLRQPGSTCQPATASARPFSPANGFWHRSAQAIMP